MIKKQSYKAAMYGCGACCAKQYILILNNKQNTVVLCQIGPYLCIPYKIQQFLNLN